MSQAICERKVGAGVIRLVQGDITRADTDAIVNAANCRLLHGGGVAGAIVRAGGDEIQRQSDEIGYCAEGDAVVTGAGRLQARYVIHAVGPKGADPQGDEKLASAARSALARARELGLCSISMPAISSGIFGFPRDRCARILLTEAEAHLSREPSSCLLRIDLCIIDDETVAAFREQWQRLWGE